MWLSPIEIPLEELRIRLPGILEQCPPFNAIAIGLPKQPISTIRFFYSPWGYVILMLDEVVAQQEAFRTFLETYRGAACDDSGIQRGYEFEACDADPVEVIHSGVVAAFGTQPTVLLSGPRSYITATTNYTPGIK